MIDRNGKVYYGDRTDLNANIDSKEINTVVKERKLAAINNNSPSRFKIVTK